MQYSFRYRVTLAWRTRSPKHAALPGFTEVCTAIIAHRAFPPDRELQSPSTHRCIASRTVASATSPSISCG